MIFPVSIDGEPLPNDLFPDFVMDRGQARRLKVIQTPAMFLGKPDARVIIPLGQSALSRDQLEQRILTAARDAGWITPEEYNRTRGFNASLALDLKPDSFPQDLKEQDLVEYIKKLYSQRVAPGGAGGVTGAGDFGVGGFGLPEDSENCGECQAKSD